jgi:hypothetical protein
VTTISDNDLLALNKLGLIPGPTESSVDFLKRTDYCLKLKEHLSTELQTKIPFTIEKESPCDFLEKGCQKTSNLFDIAPHWIPIFFSNYRLSPWHGGCAWIFQLKEETPTAALFQLRQAFRRFSSYLGIYDRDELIAHELTHVGRMLFHEPKFEEVLAYRTSHSSFRKWFGPIVQSSFESMIFVIILILICVIDISSIALGNSNTYQLVMWLKLVPISLILLSLVRLWKRHHCLSCCLRNLQTIVKEECKAWAVLYRLRDREIIAFAKMTPQQIANYAAEQAKDSLRWHLIVEAYWA